MYKRIRAAILVWLTHRIALPVLLLIRGHKTFPYTAEGLAALPENTLGNQLLTFLQENGLQLLQHYERHDIKHVLLGYAPTEEGEVCLQAFMMGNRHYTFPVVTSVLYGLCTMPEHYKVIRKAFQRGRNTPSLEHVNWFSVLEEDIKLLRSRLCIAIP